MYCFPYLSIPQSFTDKFINKVQGLKGVENIYIQHKPLLNRIVEEVFQGILREDLFPVLGGGIGGKSKFFFLTSSQAFIDFLPFSGFEGCDCIFPWGCHL